MKLYFRPERAHPRRALPPTRDTARTGGVARPGRSPRRALSAIVGSAALALAIAGTGCAIRSGPLAGLAWLEGDWRGDFGDGVFEAWYSPPGERRLVSHSVLQHDGTVHFREFETFEATPDGGIELTLFPGVEPAAAFRLTRIERRSATFENPENDFPTRIVYERTAADVLRITLSAPHRESDKVEVFELRRT